MSWFAGTRHFFAAAPDQIGPGRLILVVGPSGAGKDTLISGARAECAHDSTVVFPRRVITRAATACEDHDTVSDQMFRRAVAAGAFALWWEAHGLCYGIPGSIDADVRLGKTVVCNVSRTMVEPARRSYASVAVVHVTAPRHLLEARLAARDRRSDGNLAERVTRIATADQDVQPDVVIHNVGEPGAGIRRLVNVIRHDIVFAVY